VIPAEQILRARAIFEEEQHRHMETSAALAREMRREREAATALGEAFRELGRPRGSTRTKATAPKEQSTVTLEPNGEETDNVSLAGGTDIEGN
jgi:hypothetical protein